MKIYVLGYKGMLGRYVYSYLISQGLDVVGLSRADIDVRDLDKTQLKQSLFRKGVMLNDIIINCIGDIVINRITTNGIQPNSQDKVTAIKINSLFPLYLSDLYENENWKLIHISTDTVFSGKQGQYNETHPHDCTDIYGKTKSLGEPEKSTVIRTSIIGEEIGRSRSLIEWVKSMKNQTVRGYINNRWNGVTCLQLAKIIENIIVNNNFWKGARHIFSPEVVTKYELVKLISDIYNLNVTVIPFECDLPIDRSLTTIYNIKQFNISSLKTQIEEQRDFFEKIKNV
ncbi:MAG TPA: sugar nucleotide-binding protein [bacterium]|jgi:dTDP-4-dehydrorhamnose reductase|nr:sugar nucleotide-binding protein [bacterium]